MAGPAVAISKIGDDRGVGRFFACARVINA
jgi:hypothetical protein